jgi:hypothetical protein
MQTHHIAKMIAGNFSLFARSGAREPRIDRVSSRAAMA